MNMRRLNSVWMNSFLLSCSSSSLPKPSTRSIARSKTRLYSSKNFFVTASTSKALSSAARMLPVSRRFQKMLDTCCTAVRRGRSRSTIMRRSVGRVPSKLGWIR